MQIDKKKENELLIKKYRKLLKKAKPHLREGDTKRIRKAFMFAVNAHKNQRRRSGEPFIFHPIAVATIVTEEVGLGTTSIISALLHDVVEDTEWNLKDIEERFGKKVSRIIDGLTKLKTSTSRSVVTSLQAENFKKMLLTISEDIRVVLIKITDRLHNMRTLDSLPKHKQQKIKSETEYLYAPLAHRLGLYTIKSELEDLSLKYANPEMYAFIKKKLEDTQVIRDKFIRNFKKPIEKKLKQQDFKFKIKGRIKSITSINNKMKKQDVTFEEVYDLFAIRIILEIPNDSKEEEKRICWYTYSSVTDIYTPNQMRMRDWISNPRPNGYESLHGTVMSDAGQWVEIQIRTTRMDDIAEKGYAAHWKYKEKGVSRHKDEHALDLWIGQVRESFENNELSAIEFLDDFRDNLFDKEVNIFTPKGDVKTLRKGATVLDFAFAIHTEVGARCLGAKVNGKIASLNYQLENGDQVEILTGSQPKANEDWLKIITTSTARSKIKSYLKEDRKKMSEMGKEIIQRKLKHIKEDFNNINLNRIIDFFSLKTESDLFYKVGVGEINATQIKKFKDAIPVPELRKGKYQSVNESKTEVKKEKKRKSDDILLIGENKDHFDYSYASCCNPISGDSVMGYITISKGIKVHRTDCPNVVNLVAKYGERVIKVAWTSTLSKEFEVCLNIEGTDRLGLTRDVTEAISSQLNINMTLVHLAINHSVFSGNVTLSVKDANEVNNIIEVLKAIEGVIKVSRIES